MNLSIKGNEKLGVLLERVNKSEKLKALWDASHIMTVSRLGYSDHGPVHVSIVANLSLKLLRNLLAAGVVPSIVKDHGMKNEDAEIIVVMASVLHDIGNSIHRDEHEMLGIILAGPIIDGLTEGLYTEREAQIMKCEILHAMICHDEEAQNLTIESGVVKLADALDMKQGRARIPFKLGKQDIYAVSALAIDDVKITSSEEKPIVVEIDMNNSAGIFQVDNLLKNKLMNSGLEKHVLVRAKVREDGEKGIIKEYEMK